MPQAIAIRHVHFEDLGSFEQLICKRYDLRYIDAQDPALSSLEKEKIDLLIVLGGPMGVYEENKFPFLTRETSLLKSRLTKDLPTLGICLGSQLMASALGSKVYPNHAKEIGWIPLHMTEEGEKSFSRHLSPKLTSMFHWHGDTFDLPKGAQLLASTPLCQNQIFTWKKKGLAFQCHPEVTLDGLEKWWTGHDKEIAQTGLSVKSLKDATRNHASALQTQGALCLQEWLDSLS